MKRFVVDASDSSHDHLWHMYLSLDEDLTRTFRFVEPNRNNASAFSIEYARIILSACSAFETAARLHFGIGAKQTLWSELRSKFVSAGEFETASVDLRRGEGSLVKISPLIRPVPPAYAPAWWDANNKIKHESRSQEAHPLSVATLEHAVHACAAAYVMTLAILHRRVIRGVVEIRLHAAFVMSGMPEFRIIDPGGGELAKIRC